MKEESSAARELTDDAAQPSTSAPSSQPPGGPPGKKQYKRVEVPSAEQIMQEDFMNNCAVRTVISGVMGSALGVVFGIFMGTMDGSGMGMDMATPQQQTAREVLKQMYTTAKSRSWMYAKAFGVMGAMFAGSECVIEKARGKHDIYNSMGAGCATGSALAYSAGPKAMCAGCVTFAAFSALIDKIMDH